MFFIPVKHGYSIRAGLLLTVPFFIVWVRNRMGAGDVKLILVVALYLGLLNTLASFALMVPVLAGIMAYSWRKYKTIIFRIPFAPVIGICATGTISNLPAFFCLRK